MVMNVLDRAIQLHGALGMSDDTPIARFWREKRAMRIVDGPDEVHRMTIARRECRKLAALDRSRAQAGSDMPERQTQISAQTSGTDHAAEIERSSLPEYGEVREEEQLDWPRLHGLLARA